MLMFAVVATPIMAKGPYDPQIFLSTCQSVLEKNTDHQLVLDEQASAWDGISSAVSVCLCGRVGGISKDFLLLSLRSSLYAKAN